MSDAAQQFTSTSLRRDLGGQFVVFPGEGRLAHLSALEQLDPRKLQFPRPDIDLVRYVPSELDPGLDFLVDELHKAASSSLNADTPQYIYHDYVICLYEDEDGSPADTSHMTKATPTSSVNPVDSDAAAQVPTAPAESPETTQPPAAPGESDESAQTPTPSAESPESTQPPTALPDPTLVRRAAEEARQFDRRTEHFWQALVDSVRETYHDPEKMGEILVNWTPEAITLGGAVLRYLWKRLLGDAPLDPAQYAAKKLLDKLLECLRRFSTTDQLAECAQLSREQVALLLTGLEYRQVGQDLWAPPNVRSLYTRGQWARMNLRRFLKGRRRLVWRP